MLEKEKRKKVYSQQRETKRKSVWAIALGDKKKIITTITTTIILSLLRIFKPIHLFICNLWV